VNPATVERGLGTSLLKLGPGGQSKREAKHQKKIKRGSFREETNASKGILVKKKKGLKVCWGGGGKNGFFLGVGAVGGLMKAGSYFLHPKNRCAGSHGLGTTSYSV